MVTDFPKLINHVATDGNKTAGNNFDSNGKVLFGNPFLGEHSGDHNHQDFPKSTAIQMGGVLRYKWEAYCDTNGRSTDSISLSSKCRGIKTVQIGGVLQYKLEAYCDTFLRSSGGWGF